MKKFILSLAAASTLIGLPVAADAQSYNGSDHRSQVAQRNDSHPGASRYQAQQRYRDFRRGDRFDSRYARNYRVISNPRTYHLRAAPRGSIGSARAITRCSWAWRAGWSRR